VAVADSVPPHRLTGLRGFVLGERITDPRLKVPRPSRTLGQPPDEALLARMGVIAARACAELGLPALLLAGGEPGRAPWAVTTGHADLGSTSQDGDEPLQPSHRFPVPGVTALVTGTAVLRLVADGHIGLDDPANRHLRAVSLADDAVTVRDLLGIRAGLGWLMDGKTAAHAGTGFQAIALLRSRVRDRRTYVVLTSRAVTVESLDDRLQRTFLDT